MTPADITACPPSAPCTGPYSSLSLPVKSIYFYSAFHFPIRKSPHINIIIDNTHSQHTIPKDTRTPNISDSINNKKDRRTMKLAVIVSLLFFGLLEADAAEVRAAIPFIDWSRDTGVYLEWDQVRNNRREKKAFGKFNYGAVIRTILLSSI